MRFLAMATCLFVSLVMTSTTFYFYIVVSHYLNSKAYEGHKQAISSLIGSDLTTPRSTIDHLHSLLTRKPISHPEHVLNSKTNNDDKSLSEEVRKYKEQLLRELARREKDAANVIFRPDRDKNQYKITYNHKMRGSHYASVSSLCRAKFETYERAFAGIVDFEVLDYMPIRTLRETLNAKIGGRQTQRSCAMVSSAGALLGSNLGHEIDSHDLVLRFNNAPTEGYENDVGSKTTLRLLNSQVISSPKFNISDKLYRDTIIVGWDPMTYAIEEPYAPLPLDHDFGPNYKIARAHEPDTPFYLLSPMSVWRAWDALQNSTRTPLPKTPPSSGFLGIVFLVNFCAKISAYEYVPSIRVTHRCHYYTNETSMGCTFGDWHPLATEKSFALKVNYASDFDSVVNGKIQISGCINS